MVDTKLISANIDWATGAAKDAMQLHHLLDSIHGKGAILLQEAKNLRGAHSLLGMMPSSAPPRKIRVLHHEQDEAIAGTAIITVGLPMTATGLFLGGDTHDTLPRWVACADIRPQHHHARLLSAHVPPGRSGRAAQESYLRVVAQRTHSMNRRGLHWAVGIDANLPIHEAARILGGKAYGEGIVGIITTLEVKDHGMDRYGKSHGDTDHPAPWITI